MEHDLKQVRAFIHQHAAGGVPARLHKGRDERNLYVRTLQRDV